MLTPEDFISAGYRKFTGYTGHNCSDFGLQKLVSDGTGKRYHITVSVYDNSRYVHTHPDYYKQKPWTDFFKTFEYKAYKCFSCGYKWCWYKVKD